MHAVNVKSYGGVQRAEAAGVKYIGRPTPLGNPFTHLQGVAGTTQVESRDEAVARYRVWLWQRIQAGDAEVLNALRSLEEGDLVGCWCKPLACHADVVITAARWLRSRDAAEGRKARMKEKVNGQTVTVWEVGGEAGWRWGVFALNGNELIGGCEATKEECIRSAGKTLRDFSRFCRAWR